MYNGLRRDNDWIYLKLMSTGQTLPLILENRLEVYYLTSRYGLDDFRSLEHSEVQKGRSGHRMSAHSTKLRCLLLSLAQNLSISRFPASRNIDPA